MPDLKKILVVLEPQREEQPALQRAIYLAKATGASIHLFLCAYDTAIGIASFLSGRQKDGFINVVLDGSQVLIDKLLALTKQQGVDATGEVRWDRHPTDAILKAAAADNYDMMLKHTRHHITDVMFRSMEWSLMRYGPCPVMLVKNGQWDGVGQVLAAVDAAPESDLHEALNKCILDKSKWLAEALDFELHLVSAYPAPPVFAPVSTAADHVASYRSKMSSMVIKNLASLGDDYGVPAGHQHAIEGPVEWAIPKVSEDLVAEFVVMGNVFRQGLSGVSIGSSAESILDRLNTNVLMVRVSQLPA